MLKKKPRNKKFSGPGRRKFGAMIKRYCKFCKTKNDNVNYKDVDILKNYVTEQGKMTPSRISGNCAFHQRQLAKAIKKARSIYLLSQSERD